LPGKGITVLGYLASVSLDSSLGIDLATAGYRVVDAPSIKFDLLARVREFAMSTRSMCKLGRSGGAVAKASNGPMASSAPGFAGVGANVLVGGAGRNFSLQPVSL
jgi:hypothetical protein